MIDNPKTPLSDAENTPVIAAPELVAGQSIPFGQLARRLAASSSIYTLGNFGLRFASFLLIPLYWRFLDPSDYGLLAVAGIFTTFTAVFLGLGVSSSVTRFYHAWPAAERRVRLGSIWVLDWSSSLAIGLPILLFSEPLVTLLIKQVPFDPYLRLAALTAIFNSFDDTPLATLRIREESSLYVGSSVLSFVLQTALSIWFVVFQHHGALGVLEAQLGAAIALVPYFTFLMLKRAQLAFKTEHLGEAIFFAVPLIPSGILDALTQTMERFLLEKRVSLEDLGLYAVGDSIATAVRMLGISLKTTWWPFVMRTANEDSQAPSTIARMATFFAVPLVLFALAVAALSRDLITVVGVAKYQPATQLIPPFVITYVVLGAGTLLGTGYTIAKKNHYAGLISAVHLAVSLSSNLFFIPIYGLYGAILSFGLGWLARVTLIVGISQWFYPIPFEWDRLLKLVGGAFLIFFVSILIPLSAGLSGLVVRAALVGVYSIAVIWFVVDGRVLLDRLVNRISGRHLKWGEPK